MEKKDGHRRDEGNGRRELGKDWDVDLVYANLVTSRGVRGRGWGGAITGNAAGGRAHLLR